MLEAAGEVWVMRDYSGPLQRAPCEYGYRCGYFSRNAVVSRRAFLLVAFRYRCDVRDMRGQLAIDEYQLRKQTTAVKIMRAVAQGRQPGEHPIMHFPMHGVGIGCKAIHQRLLFMKASAGALDKPIQCVQQLLAGPFLKIHPQNLDLGIDELPTHDFD